MHRYRRIATSCWGHVLKRCLMVLIINISVILPAIRYRAYVSGTKPCVILHHQSTFSLDDVINQLLTSSSHALDNRYRDVPEVLSSLPGRTRAALMRHSLHYRAGIADQPRRPRYRSQK